MRIATSLAALALLLAPSVASAYPLLRSFTPTSVVMPILAVQLRAADGQVQPIFVCSGAELADCLIDIADDEALNSLFTSETTIDSGTYTGVSIIACGAGAGQFDVQVKGSAEIAETLWYTPANTDLVTTDPAMAGYVSAPISGCSIEVPFSAPLVVNSGDALELSALVVLDNLGWIGIGGGAVLPNCASDAALGRRVCVAYPYLVPMVGKDAPTLKRFHVTEDTVNDPTAFKAQGQVLLLLDDAGRPFGGLSRPLFLPGTVDGHVRYDTPLKRISSNGNGTYLMLNYGSSNDPTDMTNYGVKFPSFDLKTHTGTMRNVSGVPVPYLALEQP